MFKAQGFFSVSERVGFELDVLQDAAKNFKSAANQNYELTVGNRKKKTTFIIPSINVSEFTHIFGLDHLTDIPFLETHNSTQKAAVFKRILSAKLSFQDIAASKHINTAVPGSYNHQTNSGYTISERIKALSNFEDILDNAYKGKIFKWDLKKCRIKIPNGKHRKVTIQADFLLVIPTKNKNENIYLFAYQTNRDKGKTEPIKLNIFSAFPDGVDLTTGQEASYTILQEKKNEKSLFIHSAYQKQLDQKEQEQVTGRGKVTTVNFQKISFDMGYDGALALNQNTPKMTLEIFLKEVKQIFSSAIEKIKSAFKSETHINSGENTLVSHETKKTEKELVKTSVDSTKIDKPQTQPYISVSQLQENALAQKKREQQKPHPIKKKKNQQSLD